jgi:hypothetical protein
VEKSKLTETKKCETGDEQNQEMLITVCDIKGTVHKEFVLAGQTANSTYYCDYYGDCKKGANTLPQTLATKELTVPSQQHTISRFLFQVIFYQKHDCRPLNPTCLSPLLLFSVSPTEDKLKGILAQVR